MGGATNVVGWALVTYNSQDPLVLMSPWDWGLILVEDPPHIFETGIVLLNTSLFLWMNVLTYDSDGKSFSQVDGNSLSGFEDLRDEASS